MHNKKPIECPFCGSPTVLASVATEYIFESDHTVYTTGVDMNGDSFGEMFGVPTHEPIFRILKFRCTSCDKMWYSSSYKLVKGENGVFSFEKQLKGRASKG